MFSLFSQEQPETVRTSASNLWSAIGYALFGLPFAGAGLFIAGYGLFFDPGHLGMLVPAVSFGGVGGWIWWNAYKRFRRWQAYGRSQLHLETAPVPLGETLRARLRVPIAADEQPPSGFQVRVAATVERDNQTVTKWEDWTSVSGQPGPGETEVPLSIDLPARTYGDWTLEVMASFDDTDSRTGKPDYEASFNLPVNMPDHLKERSLEDLEEEAADDTSADGSISSPASADPEAEPAPNDASDEEVYWTVDEDGEEDESVVDKKTGTDEESAFTEPVSDRIEMEDGAGRRLSYSFSPATSWGKPLILSIPTVLLPLFFGVFTLLSPFATGTSAGVIVTAIVMGVAFCGVAGSFFYWYWTRWLHTATVTVENGAVTFTETPLFASGSTTTIPGEALDDVMTKRTSEPVYSLFLVQSFSRYKSTGPYSGQREIWVAGNLENKAEVDWIADRLRDAVKEGAADACAAEGSISSNESGTDTESVVSELATDRTEMEERPGHRLSVSFSPASSWTRVLTLSWLKFVLPLFLVGGGVLSALSNSAAGTIVIAIVIGVPSFAVAVPFFYWLWTRWLHTATVTVENGSVKLTNTPLFASGSTTTIPGEALDDVKVEQGTLSLVQDPSRSTGPRSHKQEIWVAGDLDNETKAEWIADRIRQAVEQQTAPA